MKENLNRTDIAEEQIKKTLEKDKKITVNRREEGGIKTVEVEIFEDNIKEFCGKKKGKYITVSFPFPFSEKQAILIKEEILNSIKKLMPKGIKKAALAGIGNADITADSLGVRVAQKTLATENFFVLIPRVEAQTGIKTQDFIFSLAKQTKSQAIIAVDALATSSVERLFKTVQITDTGIYAASFLSNRKSEINKQKTGVPVIAIGVPSVVDINTLLNSFEMGKRKEEKGLIVTPSNADYLVEVLSEIIAMAINEYSKSIKENISS